MGGQTQDLLIEVSKTLAVTQSLLEEVKDEQKEQAREIGDIRERLAKLEEAKEYSGEERRKVDGRLGSGDQTFILLRQQVSDAVGDASHAVSIASDALKAIDAHTSGKHGEITKTKRKAGWIEWAKLLAPYILPPIMTALGYAALSSKIAEKAGHP